MAEKITHLEAQTPEFPQNDGVASSPVPQIIESLVEYTPIYAVALDNQGNILAINRNLLEVLGYTREAVIGQRFLTHFVHASDRGKLTGEYRKSFWSGQPMKTEILLEAKDGQVLLVQWYSKAINDEALKLNFLFCTGIDISEQLKEKEAQYRHIFEATSDGLVVADLETKRVVEVNPAFVKMHGYTPEEFSGMDPSQFVHPDSRPLLESFFETIKKGQQFRGTAVNLRKDGSPFHVEVFGAPFNYHGKPHALAVNRDITEMVQAYQLLEQRVAERTRELSTLLEITRTVASTIELKPLLSLIMDQLKVVTDYSGAAIMVREEDAITFMEARRPDPQPAVPLTSVQLPLDENRFLWEKYMQGGQVIIDDVWADTELSRAFRQFLGGSLATNFSYVRSWMGTPMRHKGKPLGILSVSHTQPNYYTSSHAALTQAVADQAATAIENARLYEQAQAVAALEERQRLARELHDSVSQALFGISIGTNSARILLERDPSRLPQSLDYIGSLAQSGMAEMRALLFELRPESLENEGLVVALTKHAEALKARYALEIQLTLDLEPAILLPVKEAFYRIAQEAMQNTIKHAQASRINLELKAVSQALRLVITDNGQGFDPNASFPGHLGLKSMQERAARLGASFSIESRLGAGTSIKLDLPLPAGGPGSKII
jgi:PAS domain S-box-containing protein